LALSQAPPPEVIEIATKRPVTITPSSIAPTDENAADFAAGSLNPAEWFLNYPTPSALATGSLAVLTYYSSSQDGSAPTVSIRSANSNLRLSAQVTAFSSSEIRFVVPANLPAGAAQVTYRVGGITNWTTITGDLAPQIVGNKIDEVNESTALHTAFWNADAYRTFASTNALQALLVGLGVWAVYRAFGIHPTGGQKFPSSSKAVIFISATVVALSLLAPLMATIIRLHSGSRPVSVSWCGRGLTPFMIDLGRSSPFLRITPPREHTFVPNVAENRFLQDKTFANSGIAKELATLHSGDLLVFGHDLGGLNGGTDASA